MHETGRTGRARRALFLVFSCLVSAFLAFYYTAILSIALTTISETRTSYHFFPLFPLLMFCLLSSAS